MFKTWLLVGGLILLTGALLSLSLFAKKPTPAPQVQTVEKKEAATTTLSISDESKAASGSSLFKADVLIDSGENEITGAQIELTYDPKVLTRLDAVPGDFIKDPVEVIKKIDQKNGRISYVLGSKLNETSQGKGVIATITYLRLSNKETTVDFLPQTLITAKGFSQSTLVGTTPGVLGTNLIFQAPPSTASSTIR